MKASLTILLISLAIIGCRASIRSYGCKEQENVINQFYQRLKLFKTEGIPTFIEIDSISSLVSLEFRNALYDASDKENQYEKRSREPIPPLVEGNLFCSLFEGYSSIGSIHQDSSAANSFKVQLIYSENTIHLAGDTSKSPQPVIWFDRVIMNIEHQHWVIDDIILMGHGEFNFKGSLKNRLKAIGLMNITKE
jgi:hypothetical protein